tara:strand:+ start:270 stop:407 length:138 start_codon:yes stop_codon:yes gene_type:complete
VVVKEVVIHQVLIKLELPEDQAAVVEIVLVVFQVELLVELEILLL